MMKLLMVVVLAFLSVGCSSLTPISFMDDQPREPEQSSVRTIKTAKVSLKLFEAPLAEATFARYGLLKVVPEGSSDYDYLIEGSLFRRDNDTWEIPAGLTFLPHLFSLGILPGWAPYEGAYAFAVKDRSGRLLHQYVANRAPFKLQDQTSYSFAYFYTYSQFFSSIPLVPMALGLGDSRWHEDALHKLVGRLLVDMQGNGLL